MLCLIQIAMLFFGVFEENEACCAFPFLAICELCSMTAPTRLMYIAKLYCVHSFWIAHSLSLASFDLPYVVCIKCIVIYNANYILVYMDQALLPYLWWVDYILYMFIKAKYYTQNHENIFLYCKRWWFLQYVISFRIWKLWFWNVLSRKHALIDES